MPEPLSERLSEQSPFTNTGYRRLFTAQLTSLAGTGVTTVALALLAVDLAGHDAGEVLGIALALKMVVYVVGAPIMSVVSMRMTRRRWMISLDVIRAGLVLCLPLVTETWQIYVLVVAINACAASFTPVLQATIPAVLNDEQQYQKALSYTQTMYALEQMISPTLAALLLTIMTYDYLFVLNSATFFVSAAFIAATRLPTVDAPGRRGIWHNLSFGVRAYLKTPRLRAVWTMYFAVAAASAMIIVNSVVYVVGRLGLPESALGVTLAASGSGSMLGALITPRLLAHFERRTVMLCGCLALGSALMAGGGVMPNWYGLLPLWFVLGLGLGLTQTPVGSLVRMSCHDRDSAAFFAANFSLSHFCWFFGYLLAGFLGSEAGLQTAFLALGAIALTATGIGWLLFPDPDPLHLEHTHAATTHDHADSHDTLHAPVDDSVDEHEETHRHEPVTHTHYYVIDEHHPDWV